MGKTQYSDDVKAQVMAALMAGQSLSQASKEYDVPRSTVARWGRSIDEAPKIGTQKKAIGELIVEYLETNLIALRAQAEVFSNREWLMNQEASQAAVLHGVMTDKAIRLLEALAKRNAGDG